MTLISLFYVAPFFASKALSSSFVSSNSKSSKLPLGVIRKLFKNARRWSLGESGMSLSSAEPRSRENPKIPTRFGFPTVFPSEEC